MQVTHSTRSAPFSSISNSLMAHNASRTPSIAGDVFAVVVWAAMVPCFMWLGNVMGL